MKFILLFCLFGTVSLFSEDRYWVSSGNSNFRLTGNWSTTSGGAGGASIPDSTDRAIFDGNGTGRCTINNAMNVAGIWIKSSYTNRIQFTRDKEYIIGSLGFIQDGAETRINGDYLITINGDLKFSEGIFKASSATIKVSGNFWHLGGSFDHNNGTIELVGGNQYIYGSTTFYQLKKISTGVSTLFFESGTTQTIQNALTLQGDSGAVLSLRTTVAGIQANILPQGSVALQYLDVKDIVNQNNNLLNPVNSVNSGNTIDWFTTTIDKIYTTTADGSYGALSVVDISVKFSSDAKVTLSGGSLNVTLNTGTVVAINSINDSNVGSGSYTVLPGHNNPGLDATAIALVGGSLLDEGGNPVVVSLPASSIANSHQMVIDTTAATITKISSNKENGTYKLGELIPVTLSFSEEVSLTGNLNLSLNSGGVVSFGSFSGTFATAVYVVAADQNAPDLNVTSISVSSGVFADPANNPVNLGLPVSNLGVNKNINVDTLAPIFSNITSSSSNGTYKVGDSIFVILNFSESVVLEGAAEVSLDTGAVLPLLSFTGSQAILSYSVLSEEISADLNVTGITLNSGTFTDPVGNALSLSLPVSNLATNKNLVVSGQTAKISSIQSSTADGSYGVGQSIATTIYFTENVQLVGSLRLDLDTGGSVVFNSFSGNSVSGNYTVAVGQNTSDLDSIAVVLLSGTLTNTIGNPVMLSNMGNSIKIGSNIVVSTSPHITAISSATSDGLYGVGASVNVRVQFNEVATLFGGNLLITLNTGDVISVPPFTNQTTVNAAYIVGTGDTSLDLNVSSLSLSAGTLKSGGVDVSLILPFSNLATTSDIIIDSVSPTVTGFDSSAISTKYGVGAIIPITISFSESVILNGNFVLQMNSGANVTVPNFTGQSTTVNYVVGNNQTSADLDVSALVLNSGILTDVAGNSLTLSVASPNLGSVKNIEIDTSKSTITNISSLMPDGAYKQGASIDLAFQFSETVHLNGVVTVTLNTGASFVINSFSGNQVTGTYTVGADQNTTDLNVASIVLTSGSFANSLGNEVDLSLPASNLATNAQMVIDNISPTITSIYSDSPNGSYGIGADINVIVTFSEPVQIIGELALTLDTGSNLSIGSFSGTSSSVIYTVLDGDASNDLNVNSIALSAGTLTDLAGNAGSIALPSSNLANNNAIIVQGVKFRYWVRSGSRKQWTDTDYWSTSSGGPGGASVPGPNDVVIFDGNGKGHCQIKNVTADVAGMEFKSGYTRNLNFGNYGRLDIGSGGLTLEPGTTMLADNAVEINILGDLNIIGGDFNAPSSSLSLKGNFNHTSGTFTHNSGTVNMNGLDQTIFGTNTFFRFTKSNTQTATLRLESNKTQTVTSALTLVGSSNGLLHINSTQSGVRASINPTGTISSSYVDVKDINNLTNVVVNPASSLDSMNNLDWFTTYIKEISSTTADGVYGIGSTINVRIVFSSDSLVTLSGGQLRITLNTGDVLNLSSLSSKHEADFSYAVGTGDNVVGLNVQSVALVGGTLIDQGGNAVSLAMPASNLIDSSDINIDTTAATITSITSTVANGTYGVNASLPITLNFSEEVTLAGSLQVYLNTGVSLTVASFSGDTVIANYVVAQGQSVTDLNVIGVSIVSGIFVDAGNNVPNLALPISNLSSLKNIDIDGIYPTLDSVTSSSSDGTYIVGSTVGIDLNFSETVSLTGSIAVTLNTGAIVTITSASSNKLSGTYTVLAGHESVGLDATAVSLISGTILDSVGNPATIALPATTLAATRNIVVDGKLATISSLSSSTPDGTYGIGQQINISLQFSEVVDLQGELRVHFDTGGYASIASFNGVSANSIYTIGVTQNSSDLDVVSVELVSGTFLNVVGNEVALDLPTTTFASTKNIIVGTSLKVSNVTSTKPDAVYGLGTAIPFTIHFDGPVQLTGTMEVHFNTNGMATVSAFTGTSVSGSYTVGLNQNAASLKISNNGLVLTGGSTLLDTSSSSPVDLKLPIDQLSSRSIGVDTQDAVVSKVESLTANGTYGIDSAIQINFLFSERVVLDGSLSVSLNDGNSFNILSFDGTSAVGTYTVLAGNGVTDKLTVTGLALSTGTFRDAVGNLVNLGLPGSNLDNNASVYVDTTAAQIASINSSSSNGTYGPGNSLDVTTYFNETVILEGSLQVDLNSGGSFVITNFNADFASAGYLITSGEDAEDLDVVGFTLLSGTFKDAYGNAVDLTLPALNLANNKNIKVDTTDAVITSITSTSADQIYRVGDTINVLINFSKAVQMVGVLQVTLDTGAQINFASFTATSVSGSYIVGASDTSLDLDAVSVQFVSGTIFDTLGNGVNLALPSDTIADLKDIVVDSSTARYWVATSPQNFTNTNFWSTTSGGVGGASVPNASQVPVFDQNGIGNCVMNISLALQGIEIKSGYTGVISIASNKAVTFGSSGITQSSGSFTSSALDTTVNGPLKLFGGSYAAPTGGALKVSGDLTQTGGAFNAAGGSVQLTGSLQKLSGNFTFNALVKSVISADTLTFLAGSTTTVQGGMTLKGISGKRLSLRSSVAGTQFNINPSGSKTVQYLDVKDSVNMAVSAMDPIGSLDSGNNLNWFTAPAVIDSITSSTADGNYGLGDNINVSVNFSRSVILNGTLSVTLNTGSVVVINSFTGSTGQGVYVVKSGDNVADLDATAVSFSGTLVDASFGYAAIVSLPANTIADLKDISLDTVGGTLLSIKSSTTKGVLKIGDSLRTSLYFNEPVVLTGSIKVKYNFGSELTVTTVSGTSASGNYVIQGSDSSASVRVVSIFLSAGGSLKDLAGNNVDITVPAINLNVNGVFSIDSAGPLITNVSSSSADAAYKLGDTVSIQVSFNESIELNTGSGEPRILLELGATDAYASYVSHSGGVINFEYTVGDDALSSDLDVVTNGSLELNGSLLTDVNNNPANLQLPTGTKFGSLSRNKNIIIDGETPSVLIVSSASKNGSYGVGATITVNVMFDENIVVNTAGGAPRLLLETGSIDRYALYNNRVANILYFVYTVGEDDNNIDLNYVSTSALELNGSLISDDAGNVATLILPTVGSPSSLSGSKDIVVRGERATVTKVQSTLPASTYAGGSEVEISVHFSEIVFVDIVGGVPRLLLETGAIDQYANYVSGDASTELIFKYTVVAGDISTSLNYVGVNSLELNGGVLLNTLHSPVNLNLPGLASGNSLGETSGVVIKTILDTTIDVSKIRKVGDLGLVNLSFNPINDLNAGDTVDITFPAHYSVANASLLLNTFKGGGQFSLTKNGQTLRLTSDAKIVADMNMIVFDGIVATSASAASQYSVTVARQNAVVIANGTASIDSTFLVEQRPVFVSVPILNASVNTLYTYDAEATDAQNETLTYSIDASTASAGFSVAVTSGVLTWTPTVATDQFVTLYVSDGSFVVTQTFTITFNATEITPVTMLLGESSYTAYKPVANIVDNDTATHWVSGKKADDLTPEFLVFDFNSPKKLSEIQTIQTSGNGYMHPQKMIFYIGNDLSNLRLHSSVTQCSTAENTWNIFNFGNEVARYVKVVMYRRPNLLNDYYVFMAEMKFYGSDDTTPYFLTSPGTQASLGSMYTYAAQADNFGSETLSYSLNAEALAAGVTVDSSTGFVSWFPKLSNNALNVKLTATTSGNEFIVQEWAVTVNTPRITALAIDPVYSSFKEYTTHTVDKLQDNDPATFWTSCGFANTDSLQTIVYSLSDPHLVTSVEFMPRSSLTSYFPVNIKIYGGSSGLNMVLLKEVVGHTVLPNDWNKFSFNPAVVSTIKIEMNVMDYNSNLCLQVAEIAIKGGVSDSPLIVSNPPTVAKFGEVYIYTPQVIDAQNDVLTYSLNQPSLDVGMAINSATGEITWNPLWDSISQVVVMTVSDGVNVANQIWTVKLDAADITGVVIDLPRSSFGEYSNKYANNLLDGNINTYWSSPVISEVQKFVFDLTDVYQVSQVKFYPRSDSALLHPTTFRIYVGNSVDNMVLAKTVVDFVPAVGVWLNMDLGVAFGRYVKIEFEPVLVPSGTQQLQLGEIVFTGSFSQAPFISSSPVLTASHAAPYSYQVVAGNAQGAMYYSLDSDSRAAGMSIDNASGLIAWLSSAFETSRNVSVFATNGVYTDVQSWVITISYTALDQITVMPSLGYTEYNDKVVANLFDNDPSTYWSTLNKGSEVYGESFYLDLGKVSELQRVSLLPRSGLIFHHPEKFQIYAGIDPHNLTLVASETALVAVDGEWFDLLLGGVRAQYIRFDCVPTEGLVAGDYFAQLSEFKVYGAETTDTVYAGDLYTIDLVKNNEVLTINWTGLEKGGYDWVGIYKIGAADDDATWWTYIDPGASGSLNIIAPDKNIYEARYFIDSSYDKMSTSESVDVTFDGNYTVTVSTTTATKGQLITVNWTAPAGSASNDWLGLYEVGFDGWDFTWWVYTGGASTGSVQLSIPDAGSYEIVYSWDDRLLPKAKTDVITVTD